MKQTFFFLAHLACVTPVFVVNSIIVATLRILTQGFVSNLFATNCQGY